MTHARGLALLLMLAIAPRIAAAQDDQPWLRDRGPGVRTSLLGSYVRRGELLIYPFYEYYSDHDLEYKPSELGYGPSLTDYRGKYQASEGILFFGYGAGADVALEFEAAVIDATLETAANDTSSGKPPEVHESGLGDVEGQVRWRFQRETAKRPELFTFFETVFPLQRDRHLIGTQEWEFASGVGFVRGYRWGTLTLRASVEFVPEADQQVDAGEYAIEWLRRFSPRWRVAAAIEGVQLDEVALITEVQYHFGRHAYLKLNSSVGLTPNATDFAPEIGIMFPLGGN
jgi:hypothetical protein